MLNKYNISRMFILSFIILLVGGCVHKVPLAVDPTKDMSRALPRTNKIPVKVGVYVSDDIKKYIYNQKKMGMTFQMNVGEYLPPITMQMASAMFEDVVMVNSLPPYYAGYKPDVEAVIVPEILYAYGNAVGTLSGYIEAKAKTRVTAYDLGGKVVWQDEALGESRSREMSFAVAFLGGMEEVGRTGYQAAFATAVRIISDFNASPPKELYSLLEIKRVATQRNRGNSSKQDIFQNYYQKGLVQYERKNYYQALYSFEKAENLKPYDRSTLLKIGVCYAYTGSKGKALEKFRRVVDIGTGDQETSDANKWIAYLKEPLQIGLVNSHKLTDFDWGVKDFNINDAYISETLNGSQMYKIIDVNELKPPQQVNRGVEWNEFLERCSKKGIKIVILSNFDYSSQKIRIIDLPSGDIATEHFINISSIVYSTKKKEIKADIKVTDRISTIREQTKEEDESIKIKLLKKGAEKLVLRLLENEVGY